MPFKPPHRYRGDIDVRYAAQGNQRHLRAWSKTVLSTEDGGTVKDFVKFQGGTTATLQNETGIVQVGNSSGPNIGIDFDKIQARDGAGNSQTLRLNNSGGLVRLGADLSVGGSITLDSGGNLTLDAGTVTLDNNTTLRIEDGSDNAFIFDISGGSFRFRDGDDVGGFTDRFIIRGPSSGLAGDIELRDLAGGVTFWWDESAGKWKYEPNQLRFVSNNSQIQFQDGGPHGIEIIQSGLLESALYYRTGPNAWSFENSCGGKILEIDIDGNTLRHSGALIWDAGNDGPGSGLNADLLDGSHASAFASSGHGHGNHGNEDHEPDFAYDKGTTTFAPQCHFDGLENDPGLKISTSLAEHKENIRPWRISEEDWGQITTHAWESRLPADNGATGRGFVWDYLPDSVRQDKNPNIYALLAALVNRVKRLEDRMKGTT